MLKLSKLLMLLILDIFSLSDILQKERFDVDLIDFNLFFGGEILL